MAAAAARRAAAAALPATMRAVVAEASGKLRLVERPLPVPKDEEVLVKVHATALNRMDLLQAAGRYPVPAGASDVLGVELAGEVVQVGAAAVGSQVGDRVMALVAGGSYAEYATVDAGMLLPVASTMSFAQAAAIPETWLTAFQLLHLVGGPLKAGETVLVHAAGSGVGSAATQLAVGAGARVLATAGSQKKLDHAAALGASAGFNYKEGDWAPGVQEAAGDGGVQVVLDCIGGSYVQQNLQVMSTDARWVLYGLMGGAAVGDGPFLVQLLRKRIQLRSTTLRARPKAYKRDLVSKFAEHATEKFASGEYVPVLDEKSFDLADAQAAHDYMASNKNIGKIVLHVAGAGDGGSSAAAKSDL